MNIPVFDLHCDTALGMVAGSLVKFFGSFVGLV